jgi:hypothetical protein
LRNGRRSGADDSHFAVRELRQLASEVAALEEPGTGVPVGSDNPPPPSPDERSGVGSIAGLVTDVATGQPLEGIRVWIYDETGHWVLNATTQSIGIYQTGALDPGTYYARTERSPDHIDELYPELPCPGRNGCDPTLGGAITVTTGATIGIDFTLDPGGAITGTLTDAVTGEPLTGGTLIYRPDGTLYGYSDPVGTGQYVSEVGLATGTYYARAAANEYLSELYQEIDCGLENCPPWLGTPIEVVAPRTTAGVDFTLLRGGVLSGTVTDAETGEPLQGIQISVRRWAGSGTSRSTDADGNYRFPGLAPAVYFIKTFNGRGFVDEAYDDLPCPGSKCDETIGQALHLAAGQVLSGLDIDLEVGGQIVGTITDAEGGGPLDYAGVRVFDESGEEYTVSIGNSQGEYHSFSGLVPGAYYVQTWNANGHVEEIWRDVPCPGFQCDPTSGTSIVVKGPGTISGIDFALAAGGRISGRLTNAATGEPAYACVTIHGADAEPWTSSCSNADGDYVSPSGLVPGKYYAATYNWTGYLDELYPDLPCAGGLCDPTSGQELWIFDQETLPGADFDLQPGGSITGAITDADTAFWADRCVDVFDTAGRLFTSGCAFFGEGVWDSDTGLPTGEYFARTWWFLQGGHLDELYDDLPCVGSVCDPLTGTPIPVTQGVTTEEIDFVLEPDPSLFSDGFESGDTAAWAVTAF